MILFPFFRRFMTDETGAVTVDWVVLTASIVTLGTIVMFNVGFGITDLSDTVSDNIRSRDVASHTYQDKK